MTTARGPLFLIPWRGPRRPAASSRGRARAPGPGPGDDAGAAAQGRRGQSGNNTSAFQGASLAGFGFCRAQGEGRLERRRRAGRDTNFHVRTDSRDPPWSEVKLAAPGSKQLFLGALPTGSACTHCRSTAVRAKPTSSSTTSTPTWTQTRRKKPRLHQRGEGAGGWRRRSLEKCSV